MIDNIRKIFSNHQLPWISEADYKVIEEITSKAPEWTVEDLLNILWLLENEKKSKRKIGWKQSINQEIKPQYQAEINNGILAWIEQIQDNHERRKKELQNIFEENLIEDWWIKSIESIYRTIKKKNSKTIGDVSRMRIIAENLIELEKIYYSLIKNYPYDLLYTRNHYALDFTKRHNTWFRGINTHRTDKEWEQGIITEIQIITKRVKVAGTINHPFDISWQIQYPDKKIEEYVQWLLLKASIVDFQEIL